MRKTELINDNWKFVKDLQTMPDYEVVLREDGEAVKLPHTWNAVDGQDGGNDYFRGTCWYIKELNIPAHTEDEEVYVEFQAVNATADVYLNGVHVVHHDGGYSAFRENLTPHLSEKNVLCVAVDNSANDHVYPQKADFTFYGGIYRDVNLIVVPKAHFCMDYHGSNGLKVTPKINGSYADVTLEAWVENAVDGLNVTFTIEGVGTVVAQTDAGKVEAVIRIENVHLWNGLEDPYLYTVTAVCGDDEITERFGCRTFEVDKDQGFILNGKPYPLRGVSRHQDRKDVGNAVDQAMMQEDMDIICEIGANTIRLAHYQHSQAFYRLCDEVGIILWVEIPYITCHMPNGRENTREQMMDLICQNYNHPSIICWGLSNEITAHGGVSEDLMQNHRMLNDLCHNMDATRLTSMAHVFMLDIEEELVTLPDIFAYNLYYGWYLGEAEDNDKWFDRFREKYPNLPVGLSEYGADAVLAYQTNQPEMGDYTEQYQALYHEHILKMLDERPYIWASYVWNMFDFGADGRNEGGENGVNHKGLVSFDRSTRKDTFYIYKAYWSKEPFVHICGRRYVDRHEDVTTVKVYSNQNSVTLYVDDQMYETQTGQKVFEFQVPITGAHKIKAVCESLSDEIKIQKVKTPRADYILEDKTVVNWFEKEGMESPEGYFSIKDTRGEISAVPEGAVVMEHFMNVVSATRGEVAVGVELTKEMEDMLNRMTVEQMIKQAGDAVTEEFVLEINQALNKIKK